MREICMNTRSYVKLNKTDRSLKTLQKEMISSMTANSFESPDTYGIVVLMCQNIESFPFCETCNEI